MFYSHSWQSYLKFSCPNWLLFKLWSCFELYFWASACLCLFPNISLKHTQNLESLSVDYQLYFKLVWRIRSSKNSETTTLNCHDSLLFVWTWTFSSVQLTKCKCSLLTPASRSHCFRVDCVPHAGVAAAGSWDTLISKNWDNTVIPNQRLPAACAVWPTSIQKRRLFKCSAQVHIKGLHVRGL